MSRFRLALFALLVLPALPLTAQELPPPTATPSATPTPTPLPSPTLVAPIVAPTATPPIDIPTPTPTPRTIEAPTARPRPRPRPRPAPSPSATPTSPAPAIAPLPTPEPGATSAAPPAIASPLPTTDEPATTDASVWPWMLGAAVLVLAGIGLLAARRQRTPEDETIGIASDPGEPEAIVPPARAPAPTPAAPSAPPIAMPAVRLALSFRPTQVGFNMLSATAQGELTIVNEGDTVVEDVRVRTALLGAHAGQDADLAAFLAEPIGRPDVPAFALAPGESRTVRVLAAAARATLRTMTAAGRPMFVPVFAVNLRSAAGQVAQAFAIGVERVDSAKLAPFWLDVPDRSYAEVAARPHGPAVLRQPNG